MVHDCTPRIPHLVGFRFCSHFCLLVLFVVQTKEEFNKIQLELAELGTNFSNNVLDATKAFSLTLTDKADVEGLPESALALAAQSAKVCFGVLLACISVAIVDWLIDLVLHIN